MSDVRDTRQETRSNGVSQGAPLEAADARPLEGSTVDGVPVVPSGDASVSFVVEDDPDYVAPFDRDSMGHALYSALVTLALGVLGSTVLPVPYAFSKTGIAAGVATMALVALTNDITCCMLVRAAAHTGRTSYEELAYWAGGRRAKLVTQVSLLLLLYGTMCGGLAFLSDVARIMVLKGVGPTAPKLLQDDGRPVMVATVLLVLLPLCLQRHIRQFEKAATVGVVVVVVLCGLIISEAVGQGFPAVRRGELDVLDVKIDEHLPEAFAVLGFAFYMQPMLMPLVKEMPLGPAGVALTEKAVHITLFGVACGVYGTVGIFGAAIFGAETESNIMVNDLLPGHRTATLVLYAALLGYLCCGMVTTHYALRASLDLLLVGPDAPFTWRRQWAETVGVLTAAVAVALTFPTQAEKIFALTGCTAVCLVCYCIPAYIHLAVVASKHKQQKQSPEHRQQQEQLGAEAAAAALKGRAERAARRQMAPDGAADEGGTSGGLRAPLLGGEAGGGAGAGVAAAAAEQRALWRDYATAAFVSAVGVGFSCAGLWVGAVDLYQYYKAHEEPGLQPPPPPAVGSH